MKIITLPVGFIPTNCYILCDERSGSAAVIDPGFEEQRILASLLKTGCSCRYVILTHGHFDHSTAAAPVLQATGAQLVADAAETELLADASLNLHTSFYNYFKKPFVPLRADITVKDGDTLSLGTLTLSFLHTPGHTAGSCCVICGDVIFTGDTVFKEDVGRTDVPTASRADIRASAKRIAALAGDYRIYPGHGVFSSLSYERRYNIYMK